MRKFILMLMLALSVVLASCEGKEKKEQQPEQPKIETLNVDHIISTDREFMFLNYGEDYRWYETCILMKNFMDQEDVTDSVIMVNNIFQVVEGDGTCFDVHVIKIAHTLDTSYVEVVEGFWIEDYPLNNEAVVVNFNEAWTNAMEANCPKPHSQHCVLRKEVGPKDANPQYIFGNSRCQIYVDATTGDVSAIDPVLEGPLGEWP
jgi:hypothetical protein